MDKETYEALKRLIEYIKKYSKDEDINELREEIIRVSDWIAEAEKDIV